MRVPRNALLHAARGLGLFALARHLTRRRLRILCYHGFSAGDEHEIMPHMFMRATTFERRLQILRKRRIPVISLAEAVARLAQGNIRRGEAVITLDDGWASNLTIGAPILERYGYPACIYVTTEHLAAGTEVFNVALDYMIRRSAHPTLVLAGIHAELDGTYDLRANPVITSRTLIQATERAFPRLADRQRLLGPLARSLGFDLESVLAGERFRLLGREQLRELISRGFEIELHSHRHRLPGESFESVAAEIEHNREALRSLPGGERRHFCYPSGRYQPQHPQWLERLGIASATTCEPGLNAPGAQPLLLKRYLDSDRFSDIVFEAEVCGLSDLLRGLARRR